MKNRRCKYYFRVYKSSQPSQHDERVNETKETTQQFEIREKRIGIVFKVLYVVAAFFAASVISVMDQPSGELTMNYILLTGLAVFSLCLLFCLVSYVFNEMKCLRIANEDISQEAFDKTENSYSSIFTYFKAGGIAVVVCVVLLNFFIEYISNEALMGIFIGCVAVGDCLLLPWMRQGTAKTTLVGILNTVAIMGAFIAAGMK